MYKSLKVKSHYDGKRKDFIYKSSLQCRQLLSFQGTINNK